VWRGSLHANQFDVRCGGLGRRAEICGVRREDQVAIHGEQDEGGIDDVVTCAATQKDSGPAATCVIQRDDLHGVKQPCE
jgi:hypothetical protein